MRCPSCRKRVAEEAKFCPACGYQLRDREPDPTKRAVIASAILYVGVFFSLILVANLGPEGFTTTREELLWTALSYALMLGTAVIALGVLGRDSLGKSFAGPATPKWLGLGLVGGLACFALSAGWVWILMLAFGDPEAWEEPRLEGLWLATFVASVALPAFLEEWIDRGVLWVAMRRITGTAGTILATALLFGMSHGLGGGGLFEVPHRFAVGLILGWLRARSGSLWPGILAHALLNTLAILI